MRAAPTVSATKGVPPAVSTATARSKRTATSIVSPRPYASPPAGSDANATAVTVGPAATRTSTVEVAATPPPPVTVSVKVSVPSAAGASKVGRGEFAVVPSV